jgi:hypothetical protein
MGVGVIVKIDVSTPTIGGTELAMAEYKATQK